MNSKAPQGPDRSTVSVALPLPYTPTSGMKREFSPYLDFSSPLQHCIDCLAQHGLSSTGTWPESTFSLLQVICTAVSCCQKKSKKKRETEKEPMTLLESEKCHQLNLVQAFEILHYAAQWENQHILTVNTFLLVKLFCYVCIFALVLNTLRTTSCLFTSCYIFVLVGFT